MTDKYNWIPAEKVQVNDAGEYRALVNGEWRMVDKVQTNDAGQYRVAVPMPPKAETFRESMGAVMDNAGPVASNIASAGTALSNIYQGVKQRFGRGDDAAIEANRAIAQNAPAGALLGNAGLLGATAVIPGANTVAGAGTIGALTGFLTPTQNGPGQDSVMAPKQNRESVLLNTLMGGGLGAAGQAGGNWLGRYFSNRLADRTAQAAALRQQNAVRDATLEAGQHAGYVLPPSAVNPSFIGNRLESISGKAAIGQAAATKNQVVTNQLARQALGLPDNVALDAGAIKQVREAAYAPYREIAAMPERAGQTGATASLMNHTVTELNPKVALEQLKSARADAQAWFKAYNRSAHPEDLAKAKGFWATAESLEKEMENYAVSLGRQDLLPQLREARQMIAKTYDVERALNPGTGDVSARVFGRLLEKKHPLSGELETIGRFNKAFPSYTRDGAAIPTPGVSKAEALVSALMGIGGNASMGAPGAAAAALPLLSNPVRAAMLSPTVQRLMVNAGYGPGLTTRALGQLTPERAALMSRMLLQSAPAAAMLQ